MIATPFMVTGMATKVAVSLEAKLALARGAASNPTATNSGSAGFYAEEGQVAYRYILQYTLNVEPKDEEIAQSDMVEILIGQGAKGALAQTDPGPLPHLGPKSTQSRRAGGLYRSLPPG